MVAVTFKIVSLRTSTLSESVFALLKTFLELLFWNALQAGCRVSLNVGNVCKSVALKRSSVLGIVRSCTGPNLANMVDGPNFIINFLAKNSWTLSMS
jgi:hypothetical protein